MSILVNASGLPVFTSGGGMLCPETVEEGVYVPGAKATLTPSDLTYLGRYRLPDDVLTGGANDPAYRRFGFSKGAITGRYVSGQLRLLFSGGSTSGTPLAELTVGAEPTMSASAPILTLRHNYGTGYHPGGATISGAPFAIRGYHWDEANQLLWHAFYPTYGGSEKDRSVGAFLLSGDTKTVLGPWRASTVHTKKLCGDIFAPPQSFADTYMSGKTVWVSSAQHSINAPNTFGLGLYAIDPAVVSAQPASSFATQTDYAYAPTIVQDYGVSTRMSRGGTYWVDDTGGGKDTSKWSDIDTFDGVVWVENTTKRGLLCFGAFADIVAGWDYTGSGAFPSETLPHVAYQNIPSDPTCAHGQDLRPAGESTGWGVSTFVPELWIFNPDDLVTPATGGATNAMLPTSKVQLRPQFGANFPSRGAAGWENLMGGAWYDTTTRRLYMSLYAQDTTRFEPKPYIHVFEVAD